MYSPTIAFSDTPRNTVGEYTHPTSFPNVNLFSSSFYLRVLASLRSILLRDRTLTSKPNNLSDTMQLIHFPFDGMT
ncbi:MAG: hypothetical protein JWP03_3436 [Phycisphaerales bacterium]|nr:hypothetical protein [Phycisphaerales bacterium]